MCENRPKLTGPIYGSILHFPFVRLYIVPPISDLLFTTIVEPPTHLHFALSSPVHVSF